MKSNPKAQDLFRPFFGREASFEEAFPEIEKLSIEVTESEAGFHNFHKTSYDKEHPPGEFINCSNPVCYGGGFRIGMILSEIVRKKQTELNDSACCGGYEGSAKGRKRYRSCVHYFQFSIKIKYKEVEPCQTQQQSSSHQ